MNYPTQSGINRIIKQTDYQFTMIPNQAVRDPEITSNAFRLLSYLLSHENGYELVYDQIMRQTDLGKYAIQKAILLLTQKGFLRVEQSRTQEGYWGGHNYILLDPYKDTEAQSPEAVQSVAESFRHGTTSPLKEDKDSKKIKEKENNLKGWDEFWDYYPRSESKAEARNAYQKALKKTTPELLLAQVKAYIQHCQKQQIKFAYAATWLNQERWEDEYDKPQAKRMHFDEINKIIAEREERQREHDELEKNSAPPPKCEHGKLLVLCNTCIKKLG